MWIRLAVPPQHPNAVRALIATVALLLSISARDSFADSGAAASQSTTAPSETRELQKTHQELRSRIIAHNKVTPVSAWLINDEHLFVEDDSLRDPVIQFSRKPGGLDFLFGKVLDPRTSNEDLLVIAEIVVYFGGHPEEGDEKVRSNLASGSRVILAGNRRDVLKKLDGRTKAVCHLSPEVQLPGIPSQRLKSRASNSAQFL
jgi:hypothetical protein